MQKDSGSTKMSLSKPYYLTYLAPVALRSLFYYTSVIPESNCTQVNYDDYQVEVLRVKLY